MNNFFQSIVDNYKLVLGGAAILTILGVGMNNGKLALVNGVPTTPDFLYDANNDGKLDAFYLQRTHGILQGTYPEGGHVLFLDGKQLEKTEVGYERHANPLRIPGGSFCPAANYKLPLTLLVGEFDGKKGIDLRIVEMSPDFGVNYTTEINNVSIPRW